MSGLLTSWRMQATAEISRSQVWQWMHHGARLTEGPRVTRELVRKIEEDELGKLLHRPMTSSRGPGPPRSQAAWRRELFVCSRRELMLAARSRIVTGESVLGIQQMSEAQSHKAVAAHRHRQRLLVPAGTFVASHGAPPPSGRSSPLALNLPA